jgi:hypothetical protein
LSEPAAFIAYFPNIQSAIKIHGQGDGMRIQLEVPEDQMEEAKKLLEWRSGTLAVAIEPVKDEESQRDGRELHI